MEITHIVNVQLTSDERFEVERSAKGSHIDPPLLVHRVVMRDDADLAEVNGHTLVTFDALPEAIRALKPQQPVFEYAHMDEASGDIESTRFATAESATRALRMWTHLHTVVRRPKPQSWEDVVE